MRARGGKRVSPIEAARRRIGAISCCLIVFWFGALSVVGSTRAAGAAELVNAYQIIISDDITNTTTEVVHHDATRVPGSTSRGDPSPGATSRSDASASRAGGEDEKAQAQARTGKQKHRKKRGKKRGKKKGRRNGRK